MFQGDSVIRYYELENAPPYIHYLSTFQSKDAQRGLATIPKRSVDVNTCEVTKFYKLISQKTGIVKPISFTVPRKVGPCFNLCSCIVVFSAMNYFLKIRYLSFIY